MAITKASAAALAAPVGFMADLGNFFHNLIVEASDEAKSIAAKVAPTLEAIGEGVANAVHVDAETLGQMAMDSVVAEGEAVIEGKEKFSSAVTAVKQSMAVQGVTAADGLVNMVVEGAYQTLKTIGAPAPKPAG